MVSKLPLRVGDAAPDFTLRTQRGTAISLASALRDGPALIAFPGRINRAAADVRVRALARLHPSLRDRLQFFVIVPNHADAAKRYVEEVGTPFHLLCDDGDAHIAARYGVGTRRLFALGRETTPALFGVDTAGVIRYRLLASWDEHTAIEF